MTWVRIDDLFPEHEKSVTASDPASWLFVAGLCYCGRNETDGRIPAAQVPKLTALRKPMELAQRLVDVVLWEITETGYLVHNYFDYQYSRAEIEKRRGNTRKRVQKHRGNAVTDTDVTLSRVDACDGSGVVVAVEEQQTVVTGEDRRLAELLFSLIAERDPKAREPNWTQWSRDMRLLIAERGDAIEVEDVLRWSQADGFWRTNILSPGKLRKQFTQLMLRMPKPEPVESLADYSERFNALQAKARGIA